MRANDGKGNATPASPATYQYTSNFAKFRGIAVAKNGDLYAAAYNGSLIYKVSRAQASQPSSPACSPAEPQRSPADTRAARAATPATAARALR